MDGLKRHWLILLGLAALIIGGSYWGYWQKAAPALTAAVVPVIQQAPAASGSVVQVSGAINKPGLYRVGPESRVIDVINAAGGLALGADPNRVNLAQTVKDGMQVYVPLNGQPANGPTAGGPAAAGKVSINTADKAELDKLPGIGPALAQRIVEYRQANGPFKDIGDLKKVSGIGEAKFNQLKDKIAL